MTLMLIVGSFSFLQKWLLRDTEKVLGLFVLYLG